MNKDACEKQNETEHFKESPADVTATSIECSGRDVMTHFHLHHSFLYLHHFFLATPIVYRKYPGQKIKEMRAAYETKKGMNNACK